MSNCVRNQYDEPLHIREVKLVAAERGFTPYLDALAPKGDRPERVAIVATRLADYSWKHMEDAPIYQETEV